MEGLTSADAGLRVGSPGAGSGLSTGATGAAAIAAVTPWGSTALDIMTGVLAATACWVMDVVGLQTSGPLSVSLMPVHKVGVRAGQAARTGVVFPGWGFQPAQMHSSSTGQGASFETQAYQLS
jgi:hypothetical protein